MVSYIIDTNAAGEKLATTLSVILSIVLYHNRIEEKAPPVSYMTVSDNFKVFVVEIPMALMLGQNVLAIWGDHYAHTPKPNLDKHLFIGWCFYFLGAIVSFCLYTFYLWRKKMDGIKGYNYLAAAKPENSEFAGEEKDPKKKKKERTNSGIVKRNPLYDGRAENHRHNTNWGTNGN